MYTAKEFTILMSYPLEIRKFLMRAKACIHKCMTDTLENTSEVDTEVNMKMGWYLILQYVFAMNDRKEFISWKQERKLENSPVCKKYSKSPDIPQEIKGKSWKDIELPTCEECMSQFIFGRMFLALKQEMENDGYMVTFDFSKDHNPAMTISAANNDMSLEENAGKFGYSPSAATNEDRFILETRIYISSVIADHTPDEVEGVEQCVQFPIRELFRSIFAEREDSYGRKSYQKWVGGRTSDPVPEGIKGKDWYGIHESLVSGGPNEPISALLEAVENDPVMKNRGFTIEFLWDEMKLSVKWRGHVIKANDLYEGSKCLVEGYDSHVTIVE